MLTFMEVQLTEQNFENEVVKSQLPVLVDFWAPWCGPCHVIAPIVSQIAQKYQGKIKVGKLNVDENLNVSNRYQVSSIPTLKIFKNGQVVDEVVGVVAATIITKKIDQQIL